MSWSIIRIIWFRELRDLVRDRRTLFMIVVLPAVLYPLMGFIGYMFALNAIEQRTVVGIAGMNYLPNLTPRSAGFSPVPAASWLALTPEGGIDRLACAAALAQAARIDEDYPPLVINDQFPEPFCATARESEAMAIVSLLNAELAPLEARHIDVLLVVPSDFRQRLDDGGRPTLEIYTRAADGRSRLAERRLRGVLVRWKQRVKDVRLLHRGLPFDFDNPLVVRTPHLEGEAHKRTAEEMSDMVAQFFPFMLIMWAMAGALYPAIDVCAGEKERGTLETLLLSPATRTEIVCGKFLAVWVFSSITALWNLTWMGGGTWLAHAWLPFPVLRFSGLLWCAVLATLLAGLFSAVSLALGVYARSTKEGQYYLLPLILVTLPLTFLPLMPGVELNLGYSLIPVTGATLLLQKLMMTAPDQSPWPYFAPVLLSLAVSIALALRWAVAQFQREEVLFREAERLDLRGLLRRLLRLRRAP